MKQEPYDDVAMAAFFCVHSLIMFSAFVLLGLCYSKAIPV